MEKYIRDLYSEAILAEARGRYGIAADKIRLLDGFESFMYEFERPDGAFILRIGHSRRRSIPLIKGEVDWINYLAAGGAGVARAVLSANDRLVEVIEDGCGGHFLATAFVKARGGPPTKESWNEALFERYGRLIGRMHALSKDYEPPDPTWRRPEWDDPLMLDPELWRLPLEPAVVQKFQVLMAYLQSLPKEREGYGLIHQDAHGGNFFVDDEGTITLFDFDDCAYSWYIYDIAMVLFYAVANRPDANDFARVFMEHFMRGYRQENWLEPAWLREIPAFLKLREIDLYAIICRDFDVDHIEHRWTAEFMRGRKEKIENDVPYLDMDFRSLRDA
jgi:Ser/Thr protein kinase RdoA (MazF antagonist)